MRRSSIREWLKAGVTDSRERLVIVVVWVVSSWHWLSGFKLIPYDAFDEFYPVSYFVAQTLRAGDLPWWNPFQYSGTPLFADPQSLIFTAFTVVGVSVGAAYSPTIFNWVELLHVLAGGIALHAYVLRHTSEPLRRVAAVITYMLAGVATSRLQHVPQIVTYGYLPVALLLGERLIEEVTWLRTLGLSAILAAIFVNPNQLVLLGGFAVAFLLAVTLSTHHRTRVLQVVGAGGAAMLLALLAASPVLSAVVEFVGLSNRQSIDITSSVPASMPPFALLAIVFPGMFGIGGFVPQHWSPNDISENWLYVGLLPILLLASGGWRCGTRYFYFCLGATALIAIFMIGTNSAVYPWLFANVPGFHLFRRPADGAYALILLVALLIAYQGKSGTPGKRDDFQQSSIVNWRWLLAFVGFATVFASVTGLWGWVVSRHVELQFLKVAGLAAIRYLACAWLMWALASRSQRTTPYGKSTTGGLLILALLAAIEVSVPVRFGEFTGTSRSWDVGRFYRGQTDRQAGQEIATLTHWLNANGVGNEPSGYRFEAPLGAFASGLPNFAALPSTLGYAPIWLKNHERAVGAFAGPAARTFPVQAPNYTSAWFRALGLKYVMLPSSDATNIGPNEIVTAQRRIAVRAARDVLLQSAVLEPVRLAGYEVWRLAEPFAPVRLVDARQLEAAVPVDHEAPAGRCTLTQRHPSSLQATCDVLQHSVVVFSEIWYPGWYACDGSERLPLEIAWSTFRAIRLSPGIHRIAMKFEPSPILRSASCR